MGIIRIAIDYDDLMLEKIMDDLVFLIKKHDLEPSVELVETSPSHYTAVVIAPVCLDTAVQIIQDSMHKVSKWRRIK